MKIVDLLDVAKDDMFFIKDPRGDLLHTTGHFPQVGLARGKTDIRQNLTPDFQETAIPDICKYTPQANV